MSKERERPLHSEPPLVTTFEMLRDELRKVSVDVREVTPLPCTNKDIHNYLKAAKKALRCKLDVSELRAEIQDSNPNLRIFYLKTVRKYLLIACDLYKFFFGTCPQNLDILCHELGAYKDEYEKTVQFRNQRKLSEQRTKILAQLDDQSLLRFRVPPFDKRKFEKKLAKRYQKIANLIQQGTVPEPDFHWVRRALRRMMHATQVLAAEEQQNPRKKSDFANYPDIFTALYQLQKILNRSYGEESDTDQDDENTGSADEKELSFPDYFREDFAELRPLIEKVFDIKNDE